MDTKNSQDIMSKKFLNEADIRELMQVSRSTAYRIMKTLNDELDKKGKITVPAGQVRIWRIEDVQKNMGKMDAKQKSRKQALSL